MKRDAWRLTTASPPTLHPLHSANTKYSMQIKNNNSLSRYTETAITFFSGKSAQQGYFAAFDQGIISVTNFLAAIILARAVAPTEFGVYAVGFLMTRFVRAIQDGLSIQPLNTLGAVLDDQRFREYATNTGIIQLFLALASALAAASGGWLLTVTGNDVAGPTATALWFVLLTWQIQEFIRRIFYTRNDVPKAVVNTGLASIVRLGVLCLWGVQNTLSGKAGLDAIAWGSLVAVLLGLWQTRS